TRSFSSVVQRRLLFGVRFLSSLCSAPMPATVEAAWSQRDSVLCGTPVSRDNALADMRSGPAMRFTMRSLNFGEYANLHHSIAPVENLWKTSPFGELTPRIYANSCRVLRSTVPLAPQPPPIPRSNSLPPRRPRSLPRRRDGYPHRFLKRPISSFALLLQNPPPSKAVSASLRYIAGPQTAEKRFLLALLTNRWVIGEVFGRDDRCGVEAADPGSGRHESRRD